MDFRRHGRKPPTNRRFAKREPALRAVADEVETLCPEVGILARNGTWHGTHHLVLDFPGGPKASVAYFRNTDSFRVFFPYGQFGGQERYDARPPEAVASIVAMLSSRSAMWARGGSPVARPRPGVILGATT